MYGLCDCNNFYASCQRVFRPDLVGRPMVVLSNNDGCVIARSNEAKALGIRMGRTALEFDLDLANALTGLNEPVIKTARFHVKSVFCFL